MSLLESSQTFFYISVSACVVIISFIYIIKTIVITLKLNTIVKRIDAITKEIEDKVNVVKTFIDSIEEKVDNVEFYLNKIKKVSDFFTDYENDDTPKELLDENGEYEYVLKKVNKKKRKK